MALAGGPPVSWIVATAAQCPISQASANTPISRGPRSHANSLPASKSACRISNQAEMCSQVQSCSPADSSKHELGRRNTLLSTCLLLTAGMILLPVQPSHARTVKPETRRKLRENIKVVKKKAQVATEQLRNSAEDGKAASKSSK